MLLEILNLLLKLLVTYYNCYHHIQLLVRNSFDTDLLIIKFITKDKSTYVVIVNCNYLRAIVI